MTAHQDDAEPRAATRWSAELVAARREVQVARLRLLAAATAVIWGRSPAALPEQIFAEARDIARRSKI